ncbi:lamin tail domain-containing protein [Candidatus Woesearchaeota archaeon]|nr:lamin tail domain-containing protein [Candidatus Woesearchaeota archaeon]
MLLVLLVLSCSKIQNEGSEQEIQSITGSAVESQESCRLSDESDCRPIEIRRGEPENEEVEETDAVQETATAASAINLTVNETAENITVQSLLSTALICEAGWKCIKGSHIAYQEANCSWHSIEKCIYGCNENSTENKCRQAPICKINSLKCEDDNLMICGEEGYKWVLNKSCDRECEDSACTEDAAAANASNNTAQNDFIADNCMDVLKYNLTGINPSDEYFTLKNSCPYSIDMTNWTAKDNASNPHVYTFPSFNFAGNGEVTIITGSGTNTQTTLYWGSGSAVWNNNGDTLYLVTSNGTSVLTEIFVP